MLKCFAGCKHKGKLEEIYRVTINSILGEDDVVRWCPNCGAIVIDSEINGRIFPGKIQLMRFPEFKHYSTEENQLDKFTQAYIAAALWTSNLDVEHDSKDIAPETLEIIIAVCRRFQEENAKDIAAGYNYTAVERAGHDFWLTRNGHNFRLTRDGHGTGFWNENWPKEVGERLTVASEAYKSIGLYLGDDKLIHSY